MSGAQLKEAIGKNTGVTLTMGALCLIVWFVFSASNAWSSHGHALERNSEAVRRLDASLAALQAQYDRMAVEGRFPASLESRLGAIERSLAEVKALLRQSSRGESAGEQGRRPHPGMAAAPLESRSAEQAER